MDVSECISLSQLVAIISLVILAYCSLTALRLLVSIFSQSIKLFAVSALALTVVQYEYPNESTSFTSSLTHSLQPYFTQALSYSWIQNLNWGEYRSELSSAIKQGRHSTKSSDELTAISARND